MTPDSNQPYFPDGTADDSPDQLNPTQAVAAPGETQPETAGNVGDVGHFAPPPDPRPDTQWAWASSPARTTEGVPWASAATAGGTDPYAGYAADGIAPASDEPVAYATPYPEATPAPEPRRRSGAGIGSIVAASLLSAVVASGGTVLVLNQTGALERAVAAPAQTTTSQNGAGTPVSINESSAVIDAAAKVGPAVVKITVSGQGTDPFGNTPEEGVGSGIIYDANGWILTNRHVVSGATKLVVELKDGRTFDGTVYGTDTFTDLAIVKIDATGLPVAAIGKSGDLKVGQLVVAIGSPLGTYSFSVTSGIVSGKGREIQTSASTTLTNLIQTDAAINPGNSGGPLVDSNGAVVGINTAVATDSKGIGFAIPVDIARPIMNQALRGETLSRPWMGVRYTTITLQVQKELGLSVSNGAVIGTGTAGTGSAAIQAGSPAEKAGLKDGDILLAINGVKLDQEHPLDAMLVQFAPNDTVTFEVLRAGADISVPLTLGVRPANLQ